ncbi:recombinase family protein [Aliiruegeria lutimaris]|uniref:Site-specific DNA recombinase n=1 Tax=Aliiruegeria lutimaris TaxID=571298 RepID=A0A1G9IN20_9RHOB|nr:recombinase family protein [Aliiruegeria lutimaris]SDL26284.1 Site-specific DNA recombinase [Aliiruegeria lutimaris]
MKPCFGYIRVSTQKQGEGVSLEAQKDAIEAFASREDLTVIRWFEEKQTAAKGGRPIFNQMLRQLKRGAARGVIIHKIDRSARNLRDWAMFSELPDLGTDVFVATESLDFNSRGGRLTADIQAVIAADYIRNLREETKKGIDGRLKQGLYPFRAPIGYLDNGKGKPKTPDPEKAPLILEMFELYASGQHSLRSLRAEINRRGLRNHAGQPLSLCGIETILNNPFYTGLIVIQRTGRTYDGIHEPIVPATLFQQVQDMKTGRSGKKVTQHNHLYRGLFRCGLCDGPMSPELQKGRVYYRCQTRSCPTRTIREDRLEAIITDALRRLEITSKEAERLELSWEAEHGIEEQNSMRTALRLRIEKEEQRLARLTDLLLDGVIATSDYHKRKRDLEIAIAAGKEELTNLPDPAQIEAERMGFLELMKNLAGLHIRATDAEKREIVENAFSNRQVSENHVGLEPYDWLRIGETCSPVLSGAPCRDTSRTGPGLQSLLNLLKTGRGGPVASVQLGSGQSRLTDGKGLDLH